MFFSYAENTDSVSGKYRVEYLVIITDEGMYLDMLEVNSVTNRTRIKLNESVSRIFFNKLFDNSFVAISPKGEVFRVNFFGYDKEWVCLGFKFVQVESNEIYEEKEDDFEVKAAIKRKDLTVD